MQTFELSVKMKLPGSFSNKASSVLFQVLPHCVEFFFFSRNMRWRDKEGGRTKLLE